MSISVEKGSPLIEGNSVRRITLRASKTMRLKECYLTCLRGRLLERREIVQQEFAYDPWSKQDSRLIWVRAFSIIPSSLSFSHNDQLSCASLFVCMTWTRCLWSGTGSMSWLLTDAANNLEEQSDCERNENWGEVERFRSWVINILPFDRLHLFAPVHRPSPTCFPSSYVLITH